MVQYEIDLFFDYWVRLHGEDGITNYIHMLGAGHVSRFLYRWRNLYKYSQQGWENLNKLIKTFYFRRTQRGGSTGYGGTGKADKLTPLAKWAQRRLIIMADVPLVDIINLYKANETEAVAEVPLEDLGI